MGARSESYSLEEARALDSRPRNETNHRKSKTTPERSSAIEWILYWALFSFPGLVWIQDSSLGPISVITIGLLMCWFGYYWSGLCPSRNIIIKQGLGLVGVMLVVNSIASLIIPAMILLVVSFVLMPFGFGRFYAEKEEN